MSAYAIPLPPGADPGHVDDWEIVDGCPIRMVWSEKPNGLSEDLAPRAVCAQLGDGRVTVENDPPEVYFADTSMSADDARKVAAALIEVADLADLWAGQR
ncbi:hypothetical protein BST33_09975 [Mycolicibacter minnesotensis]|uniref:Uncharacterized protein n=1 Tax=Mycolicibacter minnesotensis TaxID=1118379 RepID=A0A7I7R413_9MYCO|nr:hypothetical protein [Mycolicibacter minnesotensis]ORB01088.1 hypothetical protein BST33_09975 [Mycolicibacter minnesotensis]BBY33373.1 hypothetical protein MMIN_14340 [Mycolicibacter minnesotensis]